MYFNDSVFNFTLLRKHISFVPLSRETKVVFPKLKISALQSFLRLFSFLPRIGSIHHHWLWKPILGKTIWIDKSPPDARSTENCNSHWQGCNTTSAVSMDKPFSERMEMVKPCFRWGDIYLIYWIMERVLMLRCAWN